MDVYRIMADRAKDFFCIYKAVFHNGVISMWEYIGEVQHEYNALHYINQHGREFDPKRDKVSSLAAI
mgnify:FL=1